MTEPVPYEDIDLTEVTQTRRIPVWKHRAKSWRTRALDHVTESFINGANFPSDSVDYDTIGVWIASSDVHEAGFVPRLWKREA